MSRIEKCYCVTWTEKCHCPCTSAEALGGKGGMVLITDDGPGGSLHAYLSTTPGNMTSFVAAVEPTITTHPGISGGATTKKGEWANLQIAFVPSANGSIASVAYTLWEGNAVKRGRGGMSAGMSMTVFDFHWTATAAETTDRMLPREDDSGEEA